MVRRLIWIATALLGSPLLCRGSDEAEAAARGAFDVAEWIFDSTDEKASAKSDDSASLVEDSELLETLESVRLEAAAADDDRRRAQQTCFQTNAELRAAVVAYVADRRNETSQVALTYGWPLSTWCVSSVADFTGVFADLRFNEPLTGWFTKAATTMRGMFRNNRRFNQSIDFFETATVVDMSEMFQGAAEFNQSLAGLDISAVTNMTGMLQGATSFQEDLCHWGLSTGIDASVLVTDLFARSACEAGRDPDFSSLIPGPFCTTCRAKCFQTNDELRAAVVQYAAGSNNPTTDLSKTYGFPIAEWCVRDMTNFSFIFQDLPTFNEPLSGWRTSAAKQMRGMFESARAFNQNISHFRTRSVTLFRRMFYNASAFNQDISMWSVNSGEDFSSMFQDAISFNFPLNGWRMSNATNLGSMFEGATAFHQDLDAWDVGKVEDFSRVFLGTTFNGNIVPWNTSSAIDMSRMFMENPVFDQPIVSWNVGKVTTMRRMFLDASSFNQNLKFWDVSSLEDAERMFARARAFSQNLCFWARRIFVSTITSLMFASSGCPTDLDPTFFVNRPPGPLCFECDGSETPPSGAPSAIPTISTEPTFFPTVTPRPTSRPTTGFPTSFPTQVPSQRPTFFPTVTPRPTVTPTTAPPSPAPTLSPSVRCRTPGEACADTLDCCNAFTKQRCGASNPMNVMKTSCLACSKGMAKCTIPEDCCSVKCIVMMTMGKCKPAMIPIAMMTMGA